MKTGRPHHLFTQLCLPHSSHCKIKNLFVSFVSANRNLFIFCQPFLLFCHNMMIYQWDSTQEGDERVELWHCFTAVCRAKTDNASLNGSRKEVDRSLCLKGTWNSETYEASLRQWGGGSLFRGCLNLQCKPTQVSGGRAPWSLHHENHLNGQRRGRVGTEIGQKGEVWLVCYGNSFSDTVTCYPHTTDFFIYPEMP